ncbi:UNVERIFIED_CONTAM: hypothetical protein FKN15_050659 [Acipenser sinensis]
MDAANYDLVKLAILRRLKITAETNHVRFREYQRSPDTHAKVVAEQLCDHMVHWLTSAKNLQMGEAVIVEQFCHVVGAETQASLWCHNPDTLEEAVKLAKDFEDSLVSARIRMLMAPAHWNSRAPPPISPPP